MKKGNKINTCAVYVSPTEENTGCEISEIYFFTGFTSVVDSRGFKFYANSFGRRELAFQY